MDIQDRVSKRDFCAYAINTKRLVCLSISNRPCHNRRKPDFVVCKQWSLISTLVNCSMESVTSKTCYMWDFSTIVYLYSKADRLESYVVRNPENIFLYQFYLVQKQGCGNSKGSLTLAMGKCLWFSVKIKVCQSSLSSPWSYPDLSTLWLWNPFSILNASKM